MNLDEYVNNKKQIAILTKECKGFEARQKEFMTREGMKTMTTKFGTFTVKVAYERHSFDSKKLILEHPELSKWYEKITKVAESITFKAKE